MLVMHPASAETIQLEPQHGVFMLPVRINDAITIPFVLDSGASEVVIPADVLSVLRRAGTISQQTDFRGTGTYTLADGSKISSDRYVLHKMAVGDLVITDVVANVTPAKGDPLLGQSFLLKLPGWAIDNARHALVLPNNKPHGRIVTWANGDRYDGEFRDGKQNGRGVTLRKNAIAPLALVAVAAGPGEDG
jgi:predicted aspartyl protease